MNLNERIQLMRVQYCHQFFRFIYDVICVLVKMFSDEAVLHQQSKEVNLECRQYKIHLHSMKIHTLYVRAHQQITG